eukprot:GFUD01086529.1.p1 GENE.GFUD01086529.1~~GFUD01086529.1.p1  ORF type:complete len:124 (-),score=21.17 GFUD01086529.1:53-379(-)
MSVKVKDILNVFKQNKVDRCLGLLEPLSRYSLHCGEHLEGPSSSCRPEDNQQPSTSNSGQSWTKTAQKTLVKDSKSSQKDSLPSSAWSHNNIARAEEGTTFYFRQKLS